MRLFLIVAGLASASALDFFVDQAEQGDWLALPCNESLCSSITPHLNLVYYTNLYWSSSDSLVYSTKRTDGYTSAECNNTCSQDSACIAFVQVGCLPVYISR